MAIKQLRALLDRIGDNFMQNWYNIRDLQKWMLEEIYRKHQTYPRWKKKVLFSWVSYFKSQKEKLKTPMRFFEKKLDSLFRYFIEKMFNGINASNQLELVGFTGDSISKYNNDIFFEYNYYLTEKEIQEFVWFKKKFDQPGHPFQIISYLFNIIILTFGRLTREILQNKIFQKNNISDQYLQITLLAAEIGEKDDGTKYLHFLMGLRYVDQKFLKTYLKTMIFQFAERLPNPPPKFLEYLRNEKNQIYPIAMEQYQHSRGNFNVVLYTLERKAQVLHQCTPLLDILNFICSRVEDSIFQTKSVVEEIIKQKFSTNPQVINALMDIFNFFNQTASLFSTFQSNNRANIQRQFDLFFAYSQYFCMAGPSLDQNPAFLFPEKIQTEKIEKDIDSFIKFTNFLANGMIYTDNPHFDEVFMKIFHKSVFEVNETFFETFLFSVNQRFLQLISEKQAKIPEFNFDFDNTIHFLIAIMHNLVEKLFWRASPELATENFRDKLSRYTPDRIALRVLELNIFKDIPLSDNNWQDYYLSRNKDFVKKVFTPFFTIPEKYFFSSERLLKINMIYDRALLATTPYLEEWIVNEIILQFYSFLSEVARDIPGEATKKEISSAFINYLNKSIIDPYIRENIYDLADYFRAIWQ